MYIKILKLVCVATPCQPHQGRFTAKIVFYVFTLHQTAFQPSKVVRPLCGSSSRNFKNPYRCPIINTLHPYRCQLFRYWARVALLLSAPTWPASSLSSCRTAFSDFRMEDIRSYPQAHSFHPRHFQGMPYIRGLSILPQFNFLSAGLINNST